ncbi:MAG: DNA primase, partial [FCB group bacterium]
MKITDEIREEILRHTDIVDVVSESIELRKKGKNFIGLCPFHNDKKPSLNVSPELGIYKCFACGAGGDAISFMMNYHHLNFIEAIKELAKKAGVRLPEESNEPYVKEEVDKKELVLKAINAASQFYIKMMNSSEGKVARTFFKDRGFTDEIITGFFLGYAPDSWDSLMTELKKQNFTGQTLFEAGLTVQKEDKSYYDRFRNRIMFPIQDALGKVIGFGARQLNPDDKMGKYINSPQSIVYDKSRTLYGLFQAKNEIRSKKYAIVVEGYADVLTLHQAGYTNSVASSGTALTVEQLKLLSRYTKKIYISYDADEAGIKAAERAAVLSIEN